MSNENKKENKYFRTWPEIKKDLAKIRGSASLNQGSWRKRDAFKLLFLFLIGLHVVEFAHGQAALYWQAGPDHETLKSPAIVELWKSVTESDPVATTQLADAYGSGFYGVGIDHCAALYWYGKAARLGSWESQRKVYEAYNDGFGVKRDYVLAYYWLKSASQQFEKEKGGEYAHVRLARLEERLSPAEIAGFANFDPGEQPPLSIHDDLYLGIYLNWEKKLFTGYETCRQPKW